MLRSAAGTIGTLLVVALAIGVRYWYRPAVSNSNGSGGGSGGDGCAEVEVPWLLWNSHTLLPKELPLSQKVPPRTTTRTLNTCSVFSDTYTTARQRFRWAAESLPQATMLTSLVVQSASSSSSAGNPKDEDFTLDIVVIPGALPGIAVHVSGTHGIEGYAGSAIQVAFLQGLAMSSSNNNETTTVPLSTNLCTVILVHALNPVGMATFRRFNEHNVDLNRNGLLDWQSDKRYWNAATYDKFMPLFNPSSNAMTWWNVYFVAWWRVVEAVLRHGIVTLKAALVGGQYHVPQGIFYGGAQTEPSVQLLLDWMTNYLNQQPQQPQPQVVTWLDVHTGLGRVGVDALLPSQRAVIADMRRWFPDVAWQDVATVSQGYERTMGLLTDYYQHHVELLQQQQKEAASDPTSPLDPRENRNLFVIQEFGTVHPLMVAHALILENVAHFHSSLTDAEKLDWAHTLLRPAFDPPSATFRTQVLRRGLRRLQQAIQRSIHLSSDTTVPTTNDGEPNALNE
jgi:Protein of unknown function (DUF2817)